MIKDILKKLDNKNDLSKEEMHTTIESIMTGKVNDGDMELAFILLIAQQHHLLLQLLVVLQLQNMAIKLYPVNREVLTS